MLSKEEFVRRILDGKVTAPPASAQQAVPAIAPGFDDFEEEPDPTEAAKDIRFARLLLEESGFGRGETVPSLELVIGDQKTGRFLPKGATYWAKSPEHPHIIMFDLAEDKATDAAARAQERKSAVDDQRASRQWPLSDPFFRQTDQLEDALHRVVQDALEGFERGGAEHSHARKQGIQVETLCVVSVIDQRKQGQPRQLVCFGTKCITTNALEVFTLREEVRDWDRPLAEEHLGQLYERHFKELALPESLWHRAFVSEEEQSLANALLAACTRTELTGGAEGAVKASVFNLLDELATTFGIPRTKMVAGKKCSLEMEDLPPDHSIAVDPDASRRKGFVNKLKGMRIFDSGDRLLGYIVYIADTQENLQLLRDNLKAHNHFHNVLVVYPDADGGSLELWQGAEPLRGRLTAGANRSRFDGAGGVVQLLSRFFVVSRSTISTPAELARELAWRARHLKAIALDELKRETAQKEGPLYDLFQDFNQALAHQEPEQFADTYAQTIAYGMLAARWLARDKLTRFNRHEAMNLLPSTSEFLRQLFNRLINNENYDTNLTWLLDDITGLLSRTLVREVFHGEKDPSIHFYQDFLDAYDPALRRRMGVYYTPDEVVEYIVRLLDHLARTRLGLRLGLADPIKWGEYSRERGVATPTGVKDSDYVVQILDPATGTGTFLLHVVELTFRTMMAEYAALGYGEEEAATAWRSYVSEALLPRLNAFELMMAPYIVTHLRLGLALEQGLAEGLAEGRGLKRDEEEWRLLVQRWGYQFKPGDRLRVFLTNSLEIHVNQQFDWLSPDVAAEANEAERVKKESPILVVLGNPPYERISADADPTANWILNGRVPGRDTEKSLFDDIRDIARKHTIFSHLRSLPDRYVYFWRWAFWKAFEQRQSPSLVGFITNSTWLRGPGFVGLRQIAREHGDEIWTVDLGGGNGTRPEPNVFNIETPVAITTVVRFAQEIRGTPAVAAYRKVDGLSRQEKLDQLLSIPKPDLAPNSSWNRSGIGWMETLVPTTGDADWRALVPLSDIFPWQQPGCLASRTWPIAPLRGLLSDRWAAFVAAPVGQRPSLFATAKTGRSITTSVPGYARLSQVGPSEPHEELIRYAARSFDRQWIFRDPRLLKTESPSLWRSLSVHQVFLCSLMSVAIDKGPAIVGTSHIPDFHHFRGSYGGKDILPLYRDAQASQPNITNGLLSTLARALQVDEPSPEDLAAYVYSLLSAVRYHERFSVALKTPGPRVPLTSDPELWSEAVALGKNLLWLHTYTERFREPAEGRHDTLPTVPGLGWTAPVTVMPEKPSNIKYDTAAHVLSVGNGTVAGVRPDVMAYSVSGMEVVNKWLGYRTAKGAGKAASSTNPLDKIRPTTWPEEWNRELIELLTVLTLTLDRQLIQAALLDAICDGPLIAASDLPMPTASEREEPKNPRATKQTQLI